jgi:uncharacterized protein
MPPPTATAPPPAALDRYRATAARRAEERLRALAAREARAWEVAREAAGIVKARYHATRVAVFGSLTRPGAFTRWSDVDLAAWGLRSEDTFAAIAAVLGLDPDVEVNLVDVTTCTPELLAVIEREGRAL